MTDELITDPSRFPQATAPLSSNDTPSVHTERIIELATRTGQDSRERTKVDIELAVTDAPYQAVTVAAQAVHQCMLGAITTLNRVLEGVPRRAIVKYGSLGPAMRTCQNVTSRYDDTEMSKGEVGREITEMMARRWEAEFWTKEWEACSAEFEGRPERTRAYCKHGAHPEQTSSKGVSQSADSPASMGH